MLSCEVIFRPHIVHDKRPLTSWGDRMLVRIDYTKSEGIIQFDDNTNRMTRNLEYRDWGEFLVVWRKDSVEIYNDYVRVEP
jgi:hypothetical protein